jgi:UDP-N-acetylmuramyl tripeptide synthase
LVLNADDPMLLARGESASIDITWFSLDPKHPRLEQSRAQGTPVCTVEDDWIVYSSAGNGHALIRVEEIPITLGGAATHNVANALGVVGLAAALNASRKHITEGLRSMRPTDNPGRCNLFNIRGATAIVDFAHNPHGVGAFLDMGRQMPAARRFLVIGQAGDRSDEDIRGLVRAACALPLERVFIKEMRGYSRGRAHGETAAIIRDEFMAQGYADDKLVVIERELEAVTRALDLSREGDLVMLLIHEDRDEALRYLAGCEAAR